MKYFERDSRNFIFTGEQTFPKVIRLWCGEVFRSKSESGRERSFLIKPLSDFHSFRTSLSNMAEVIEGEWKDFVFKMAKPQDTPRILELFRYEFYPTEPLCSMMASTEEGFDVMGEDYAPSICAALKDNLSFYAEHKDTKKLAGVQVITLERKGCTPPSRHIYKNPLNEVIINCLDAVSVKADIFSLYPDTDYYADIFMMTVASEFRRQGLATELFIRAITLLQALNFPLCKSVLTSPFTQRVCSTLKFTEHARLYVKDFKDEDGKPFFPNAPDDYFIITSAKRL